MFEMLSFVLQKSEVEKQDQLDSDSEMYVEGKDIFKALDIVFGIISYIILIGVIVAYFTIVLQNF